MEIEQEDRYLKNAMRRSSQTETLSGENGVCKMEGRDNFLKRRWITPVTCPAKAGTDKHSKRSHRDAHLIGDLWRTFSDPGRGKSVCREGVVGEGRKEAGFPYRILWE